MKKLLALLIIILFACSNNEKVAGASTVETENAAIDSAFVVRVFYSDSTLAKGIVARLRPAWYVHSINDSIHNTSTEMVTDSMGRIILHKLSNDKMFLEVLNDEEGLFRPLNNSEIKKGKITDFTLEKCGSLSGKIQLPKGKKYAWVQAYGTDKLEKTDSSGNFKFNLLPPAKYRIRSIVSEDAAAIGEGDYIVSAGKDVNAGQLKTSNDEPLELWPYSKTIEMNSIISEWMNPIADTTIAFLRLNSSSFNFKESMANGNDIRFTDQNGNRLRSKISTWDDSLQNAKIMIRFEDSKKIKSIQMYWGKKASADINDTNIWENIPDSLRLLLNSVTLIDFESRKLESAFEYSDGAKRDWYYKAQDSNVTMFPTMENIDEAFEKDETRPGTVFHWKSTSKKNSRWSMIGSRISNNPTNISALDSATFYAKGSGELGFVFEVLDEPTGKVKYVDSLSNEWKYYHITPDKFVKGDNLYGNMGWNFVKRRTTTFTFWIVENSEIWIDDIRLYGINRDDFN